MESNPKPEGQAPPKSTALARISTTHLHAPMRDCINHARYARARARGIWVLF